MKLKKKIGLGYAFLFGEEGEGYFQFFKFESFEVFGLSSFRYQARRAGRMYEAANFGGNKWGNGQWLGILHEDFVAVLGFDTLTIIQRVGFSCIEEAAAGIYFPAGVEVAVSEDVRDFRTQETWGHNRPLPIARTPDIRTQVITLEFEPTACRYLRVKAAYQQVEGQGVFIFVDEVVVE